MPKLRRGDSHRWHLDGEPLHCGTQLEVLIEGRWLRCRFETSGGRPRLYLSEGLYLAGEVEQADVRWPASE